MSEGAFARTLLRPLGNAMVMLVVVFLLLVGFTDFRLSAGDNKAGTRGLYALRSQLTSDNTSIKKDYNH